MKGKNYRRATLRKLPSTKLLKTMYYRWHVSNSISLESLVRWKHQDTWIPTSDFVVRINGKHDNSSIRKKCKGLAKLEIEGT